MNPTRLFDRVHGAIDLPPLVAQLSVTPEFFRLDGVRQLGGCAFVYPSATHTRREHSLGVSYLAGRLARHLQAEHPYLVDESDVLCVQVAGLVHDLGHGPFSHLFEDFVRETVPGWSHEEMGLAIFRRLLRVHKIPFSVHDLAFVDLCVRGLAEDAPWPAETGRGEEKRFLVDLVHNHTSGMDVDKLDYLARDALAVFGATRALDIERILRGVHLDEDHRIVFDASVAPDLCEVYALRAKLHRQVYQHRTVVVVETLLKDTMRALGRSLPCAAQDPELFLQLTDAKVLAMACAAAPAEWKALHTRPWLRRVPGTAVLHTKPLCSKCASPTEIADKFCTTCGESTATRRGVDLGDGVLVPVECCITETGATQLLRTYFGLPVRVLIADVYHGATTTTKDPHGRVWRTYDALSRVRLRGAHVTAPAMPRHVRTAHCYLPADASDADVRTAHVAFAAWATTVGRLEGEEE
jgi:HD superfamily phosphohydrolase